MTTSQPILEFADYQRLVARLSYSINDNRQITFLLGSAINTPPTPSETQAGERGVPSASQIIESIIAAFTDPHEQDALSLALSQKNTTAGKYQEAMKFVIDCRGQSHLNQVIQDAVLQARTQPPRHSLSATELQQLDRDVNGWQLRPAADAIGQLVSAFPHVFTQPILTSNFDPLIEVGVRKYGRNPITVSLTTDGQFHNVLNSEDQISVVHFHGYWIGADTLHTPARLTQNRPSLKGSLRSLLRDTTLVVLGYGGWDDVVTKTLIEVIAEQSETLDVLWAFYSGNEEQILREHKHLIDALSPLAGQRVVFYRGVDCHVLLPHLCHRLKVPPQVGSAASPRSQSTKPAGVAQKLSTSATPPSVPANWIGREQELRKLLTADQRIVAISGFGGVGKSSLAARYLWHRSNSGETKTWAWFDCHEDSNTLRTQLIQSILAMSSDIIAEAIEDQTDAELSRLWVRLSSLSNGIFVFDNVDSYVDLDDGTPVEAVSKPLQA